MALVRAAVFTLNNPGEVPVNWTEYVRYGVYQLERGESGTPHYQGYAEFTKPVRFSALKKWMPTAHWEQRRGSRDQARAYCMKEDTRVAGPFEHGDWAAGGQGSRTDVAAAAQTLREDIGTARPFARVTDEHTVAVIKYHRGLEFVANEFVPPRTEPPEVVVFYGPTGSGKSRSAREFLEEDEPAQWDPSMGTWFDGYLGQRVFLFEEFRGQLPMAVMLTLLDRYTARVQVKGGMRKFVATKIAITSPKHPRLWYPEQSDDRVEQLMRRITRIVRLGPDPQPQPSLEDIL